MVDSIDKTKCISELQKKQKLWDYKTVTLWVGHMNLDNRYESCDSDAEILGSSSTVRKELTSGKTVRTDNDFR